MIKRFRMIGKVMFILYILFLLYFLIFSDWYGRGGFYSEFHYNLVPFQEILRYWNYRDQLGMLTFANLVGNVAVFIPFGFLGAMAVSQRSFVRTFLDGFLISLVVETFQLIAMIGSFDVDDLILNTAGAVLGYILFGICNAIRRMYDKTQERA